MAADFIELDGIKYNINGPDEFSRDGETAWIEPTGLLLRSGGASKKFIGDFQYANMAVSTEAELNTAIATLSSGGMILVKNSFNITTSKTLPNFTVLIGRGYKTELNLTAGSSITLNTDSSIRDLGIKTTNTTGSLISISGSRSIIEEVKLTVTNSNSITAISVSGINNAIYRCIFYGVVGVGPAIGINYLSGSGHVDRHCAFL